MKRPSSRAGEEGGEVVAQQHEAVSGNGNNRRNHNDGIRTPRLWLRGAREGDLNAFHTFFSDADVMRYWYVQIISATSNVSNIMSLFINHCSLHGLAHASDSGPHPLRTKRRTHKDTLNGLEHVY